jgi:hypothetical protein
MTEACSSNIKSACGSSHNSEYEQVYSQRHVGAGIDPHQTNEFIVNICYCLVLSYYQQLLLLPLFLYLYHVKSYVLA